MTVKVGDTIKVTDGTKDDGEVVVVKEITDFVLWAENSNGKRIVIANLDFCYKVLGTNRQKLLDFLTKNKVKKTKLSLYLGKAGSYLTTMSSQKEFERRGDISDSTLQKIINMIHIDWSSSKPVKVKSDGYLEYTTSPSNYTNYMHKSRLQQAFWNERR